MYRKQVLAREVCKKCEVRIPKNRPKLICCTCNEIKHYKCEKMSKNDAINLINKQPYDWMCSECMLDALPINACWPTKRARRNDSTPAKYSITCFACQGHSYSKAKVKTCPLCDNLCHAKCVKGSLGCIKCCENTIPVFFATATK